MIKEADGIQMRINGLHSGTILRERRLDSGVTEQWHEHPETGEVVVVHTWRVQDGECVLSEAEVIEVYPKQKGLVDCIRGMEVLFNQLQKL